MWILGIIQFRGRNSGADFQNLRLTCHEKDNHRKGKYCFNVFVVYVDNLGANQEVEPVGAHATEFSRTRSAMSLGGQKRFLPICRQFALNFYHILSNKYKGFRSNLLLPFF